MSTFNGDRLIHQLAIVLLISWLKADLGTAYIAAGSGQNLGKCGLLNVPRLIFGLFVGYLSMLLSVDSRWMKFYSIYSVSSCDAVSFCLPSLPFLLSLLPHLPSAFKLLPNLIRLSRSHSSLLPRASLSITFFTSAPPPISDHVTSCHNLQSSSYLRLWL